MFLAGQEIKNPLASELASVFDLLTLVSHKSFIMKEQKKGKIYGNQRNQSRRRPRINEKMQNGGEDDTKNQRADRRYV